MKWKRLSVHVPLAIPNCTVLLPKSPFVCYGLRVQPWEYTHTHTDTQTERQTDRNTAPIIWPRPLTREVMIISKEKSLLKQDYEYNSMINEVNIMCRPDRKPEKWIIFTAYSVVKGSQVKSYTSKKVKQYINHCLLASWSRMSQTCTWLQLILSISGFHWLRG